MHHDYPTIVYSKEPLLDRKLITDFLVTNDIQFEQVNNVYRDYEAFIKVNNISPNFRQNNSPSSRRNHTANPSPVRPYSKVDYSSSHFEKLRSQYSPVKNMITKKVTRTPDNQMRNSYTGKKLNGRSRSEISNPLADKSQEKSKNGFNPSDRSASIEGNGISGYPHFSNGNGNSEVVPLNTMANVITNELKIFFEKNASVLKGESSANIKESIRRICTQTLQGFGLDEMQEKTVLNQAMMNLEKILLAKVQNRPENAFQGPVNSLETGGEFNSPSLHVERVLSFGNNLTLGEDSQISPNGRTLQFNNGYINGRQNTLNSQYTSPGSSKMGTNVFESLQRYNNYSSEDIPTPKLGASREDIKAYNELKRQAIEDRYRLVLTTQGHEINSAAASVDTGSNLVITTRKSTESMRYQGSKGTEESDHWASPKQNMGIDPRGKVNPNSLKKALSQSNQIQNRKQAISQMIPSNPYGSPTSLTDKLFEAPNSSQMQIKTMLDNKQPQLRNRESLLSQSSQPFPSNRNESPSKIQSNKTNLKTSSSSTTASSLKQPPNPYLRQTNAVKMLNQKLKNQRTKSPSPISQRPQNEPEIKSSKSLIEENQTLLLSPPMSQLKAWNSKPFAQNNEFAIEEHDEEFDSQYQQSQNYVSEVQPPLFSSNGSKKMSVDDFKNLEKPANPMVKRTWFHEPKQLQQRQENRLNHSFVDRRADLSKDLSGSIERSYSPPANRSFVFSNGSPENEHARSMRRKMAEERYNDYTKRTLQKLIYSNNKKLESFRDKSSDKKVCDFDRLSTPQILEYHKIIVQNSKFQAIDVLRKASIENVIKQNLGIY